MALHYNIHRIFPGIITGNDFNEITNETFIVISNEVVFDLFRRKYKTFPHKGLFFLDDNTSTEVNRLLQEIKNIEGSLLGIGGGAVMDASKYIAHALGKPLFLIPSATTTDSFLTEVAALKNMQTNVEEIHETKRAETVFFDTGILTEAPPRFNSAGLGDVLSMYTASYDWKLSRQKTGEPFEPQLVEMAMGLIRSLEPVMDEIRKNSDRGVKHIIDSLICEYFIYKLAGSNRPEVGSEHFFARVFEENQIGNFLHGEIVALGVVLMTYFQKRDYQWIRSIIEGLGINYKPRDLGIGEDELLRFTCSLNDYAVQRKLRYTVLNECELTEPKVKEAFDAILGS